MQAHKIGNSKIFTRRRFLKGKRSFSDETPSESKKVQESGSFNNNTKTIDVN